MKNIILIGMPGTGKSVVGQALAQRMNYQLSLIHISHTG